MIKVERYLFLVLLFVFCFSGTKTFCTSQTISNVGAYKNFEIKIGNKWFKADTKINKIYLLLNKPIALRSVSDTAKIFSIDKFLWTVSAASDTVVTGEFFSVTGAQPQFDQLGKGTVLIVNNIKSTTKHEGIVCPTFFKFTVE